MDDANPNQRQQSTLTDNAISAVGQEPSSGSQDGHDSSSAVQDPSEQATHTGHAEPDVMEMRFYPDLVVIDSRSLARPPKGVPTSVWKFWRRHVSISVPHEASRDQLALERTYLSYLRTSLTFAQLGVIVAQLFRVQHTSRPNAQMGFYLLGKPLACTCYGIGVLIAISGSARFYKQQNAMVRGNIWAGGWEIWILWIVLLILLLAAFIVTMVIDISREDVPNSSNDLRGT